MGSIGLVCLCQAVPVAIDLLVAFLNMEIFVHVCGHTDMCRGWVGGGFCH